MTSLSGKIKVGVAGATGYMGGEAIRILLEHPEVEIAWLSSRNGGKIENSHPNFYGFDLALIKQEDATPCDIVFLALPTEASISAARKFLDMGCKVIDLGSAFRLSNRATWERVYNQKHTEWNLAEEAVYGVTELHREAIGKARLIANPGCFSSAAILALAPLVKNGLIDAGRIVVNGLSGTAGVGAELSRAAHHPEIANNLVPYNVIGHRHTFEMEQELSALAGLPVSVHFTPVYVPIVRGILDICHVFPVKPVDREMLLSVFREFYSREFFVRVYDLPREDGAAWQYRPYPWVSAVSGTNFCHIGLDYDPVRNRIVIFSALDSIGKGGAHVAVENMNLMFGLDRALGLRRAGSHPI